MGINLPNLVNKSLLIDLYWHLLPKIFRFLILVDFIKIFFIALAPVYTVNEIGIYLFVKSVRVRVIRCCFINNH